MIVYTVGGHEFVVKSCSADQDDAGSADFLNCLDPLDNEVLIDITQVVACKIVNSRSDAGIAML